VNNPADSIRDGLAALVPRLRRFGRALARNQDDADDLVQIAIERALRNAAQWQPGTRLDHWVIGIMRNAWIDETRARKRRSAVFAPEEMGERVGDTPMESVGEMLDIQDAVAQLPEEQRIAVALVLVEGLSYREAAELLEIPIGTLTSRLARARTSLQDVLGGGRRRQAMKYSDEILMAYADGELDEATRAEIDAAAAADPAVAAAIARHRQLRERLRAGFDRVLDEPVPRRLVEALDASADAERAAGPAPLPMRHAAPPAGVRRWSWPESQDLARGIAPGQAGHAAAGMRTRPAQVQAGQAPR
jgi:RNA polymerase sigma-70 factor, ECF subfamily